MNAVPYRILIIDDNPAVHEDFRKVLGGVSSVRQQLDEMRSRLFPNLAPQGAVAGYRLDTASQGSEGLARVQSALRDRDPYALAFVDMRMPPGWDGLETIEQLWKAQPDLQIVICSAYSDHSWEDIRQRLGETDGLLILRKPFDNIEVLQMAKALTRKWAATLQAHLKLEELNQMVRERTLELEREMGRRRQAQGELERSEEMFRQLFKLAPVPLVLMRQSDSTALMANQTAAALFETQPDQVVGRHAGEFYWHPEDRQRVLKTLAEGKPVQGWELLMKTQTHRAVWVHLWIQSFSYHGEPVLLASPVDVTQRRETEERLRLALRASKQGMYDLNVQTGVAQVTPEYATMLGYDPQDFRETNARWIERLHPEDRERVIGIYRSYIDGQLPRYEVEFRQRTREGDWKWILSLGEIVARDASGKPLRMLGTHTDITSRKQSEEEQLRLQMRLLHDQKLESLGVLAGGIAHDFNNLLCVILGEAELLQYDLPKDSPQLESLAAIRKATARGADLARQMLAYAGQGRVRFEPLCLNDVAALAESWWATAATAQITLEAKLADRLPTVMGDLEQLRQCLRYVLTNAIEAIGERKGSVTITSGVRECDRAFLDVDNPASPPARSAPLPEGSYAFLRVTDTGCGMDAKTLSRIFEPFFSTKFTGRGLGLPALQGILQVHQGAVKVVSEPGTGTTVEMLLPVSLKAQELSGTHRSDHRTAEEPGCQGSVLLVDDEAPVRAVGQRLLERLGFEVLAAANGYEAIALYQAQTARIRCVLLDMSMPELEGGAVFEKLRRIRPDVRVILCSGYSREQLMERLRGEGYAEVLQKPYTPDDLEVALNKTLGRPSPPSEG